MTWVLVPCLVECGDQMNRRFPHRDKTSDGTIGDQAHAASASSHNPDLTGIPEYRDGDRADEVRARDIDKDLNDPNVVFEDIIQLWVIQARAGAMPWLRYLVYNRRIWHKRDGFLTHAYTGSNTHEDHGHVNSDFTQYADTVTGTDWQLSKLPGGEENMWCKKTDKSDNVGDLQNRLIEVGIPVGPGDPANGIPVEPIDPNDPYRRADKEYGSWTSRAVASLGAVAGDTGESFGSDQNRALRALERAHGGNGGLAPHTHTFDPAEGVSGPAVKS